MACGRTSQKACLGRLGGVWRRATIAAARFIVVAALAAPGIAAAPPLKATLEAKASDGYARIVFTMSEYNDATVRVANNVLVITFKRPVDVSLDRLSTQIPDYIGAARSDPDGTAIRVALEQEVKAHVTAAGEKLFIDLMPNTWKGVPPGLPQDVIDDLARRAREADVLLRKQHQATQQQKDLPPVRVHVGIQPTFARYAFEVPADTSVTTDRTKEGLALTFDAPIKFDLGDAAAALPSEVTAIDSQMQDASTYVLFKLAGNADVRTFRDGGSYMVDVVIAAAKVPAPGLPAALQRGASLATTPPAGTGAPAAAVSPPPSQPPPPAAAPSLPPTPPSPAPAAAAAPAPPPPPAPAASASPPPAPPPPQAPAVAASSAKAPAPSAQAAAPVVPPTETKPAAPAAPLPPPPAATANDVPKAAAPAVAAEPATPQANAPAAPAAPVAPRPKTAAATSGATSNGDAGRKVTAELARQGANVKLTFPFMTPTAGAVFNRADTLWIVFDSTAVIDLGALQGEASRTIRGVDFVQTADADIIRIKLDHPHLSSVDTDGPAWTVEIGDSALAPARALDINRNMIGPNRSSITIPFDEPHLVHRFDDPEAGDQLIVVTGFTPARGMVNTKDFIEFRALASTQGLVIEPLADDVRVDLAPDKIVISRPTGLTLSASLQNLLHGSALRPSTFDSQIWGFDRQGSYSERQATLIAAAAAAPQNKRLASRLDLARFYLARDMYPEAKGVLDVALADEHAASEDVSATVLRAVAEIMMNRPEEALKDLADPAVGEQHDAALWRALAYARQGKWAQARDGFKTADAAVATLPIELQRAALKDEMRSAIEVGDFSTASDQLNDFETIGVPHDMEPAMAVLIGRLAEGLGRTEDALAAYQTAADSWDRRAAAQGELRQTVLRYALGDLKRDDVISELETLTTVWRGDETEIEALSVLARLYTEEGRYRDAFYVMRSAIAAHPDWDMTRKIQQEAAATFDSLFLAGKGDSMSAIDALALFYDFRELTPIGRRGDEMIRRLADRLVSVDLLDQAADLLQYQVDNRLQGAARAQVATRLAVIYLMNRKADRALATLRATRSGDLANDLRDQRLLLEARALSDMSRHDLALEVVANVDGRAAIRLRSDIYWSAQRWREAAEQIELLYGERWKEWQPLNEIERADILRAEIGYALAEDKLGIGRLREKYAAKMAQTPDAHAFEVVSAPLANGGAEFGAIAHAAAAVDTLDGFLRDMQARYPESNPIPPPSVQLPEPATAGAPAASSQAPGTGPVTPPAAPPAPPARAGGRTAQR